MTSVAVPVRVTSGPLRVSVDPNRARRVPGSVWVFLLGVAVVAVASVYTVRTGTNLDYGDARAHLAIARRITDSKQPGLVQLGSVWLPVPHLLLLPLVQNLWMFSSGVAGCVLGALCMGTSSAALWRITARLRMPLLPRVVALAVLLANPSLLYVSTTALTEPVLVAAVLCTIAGLAGWATSHRMLSGGELAVFAGLPAAMGVLTRYEAWALALAGVFFVVIVSRRKGRTWRASIVWAASFAAPSAVAVAWWLAYNTAVFGNPLEFLTGQYAAAAFTEVFEREGQLSTKHNAGLSAAVYGRAMLETSGLAVMVIAFVGLALTCWRWALDDRALVVWLGGATSAFLLFSLVSGQHIMVNDAALPPGAYNNRYVLSAVPWLALLTGLAVSHLMALVGHWREWLFVPVAVAGAALVAVVLVAQNVYWAGDPGGRMTIIEEAEAQHAEYVVMRESAHWLRDHYDGGDVLMDQTPADFSLAPDLGIPIRDFYTRAVGGLFDEAVADPWSHARWVMMHIRPIESGGTDTERDLVSDALADDPAFHAAYRLGYSQGNVGIYRRVEQP
ncbi:MAG: hypothetical protein CMH83_18120 [Nocardioides sp.]|nr:hypothetical protein [Nocardioides sp.]